MGRFSELVSSVHVPPNLRAGWWGKDNSQEASTPTEEELIIAAKKQAEQEAEAEQRRVDFERKKQDTSNKYYWLLEGKVHPTEAARKAAILESQDIAFTLDPETNEITHLEWDTKEQDFAAFTTLIQRIRDTLYMDDKQYRTYIEGIMYELAETSPLYGRLDNDTIPRSPAHISNPLEHTIEVARNMRTDDLNPWFVFWDRLNAPMHDLAKIGIATNDHTHIHAELSYEIWMQYFMEHPLPEFDVPNVEIRRKQIEVFLSPIRYHHLTEAVQFGAITPEDAFNLTLAQPLSKDEMLELMIYSKDHHNIRIIDPEEALFMIGTLSAADAASVDRYLPFAIMNASVFFTEIFAQLETIDWEKYPQDYIRQTIDWVQKLLVVITSPDPEAAFGMLDDRVAIDPTLKGDMPYSVAHVQASTAKYKNLRKFAVTNGIIH